MRRHPALMVDDRRNPGDGRDARDKRPFLTMSWSSWEIIQRAMKAGMTFGEAATLGVCWYEG